MVAVTLRYFCVREHLVWWGSVDLMILVVDTRAALMLWSPAWTRTDTCTHV